MSLVDDLTEIAAPPPPPCKFVAATEHLDLDTLEALGRAVSAIRAWRDADGPNTSRSPSATKLYDKLTANGITVTSKHVKDHVFGRCRCVTDR